MTFWLPQFGKIKDFCSFQKQLQTFPPKQQPGKFELQNTSQTFDHDQRITKRIRSIKKEHKSMEISFQQHFIQQHIEAYNFKIQSYLQQMFSEIEIGNKPLVNEQIFPKKSIPLNHPYQVEYYLASSNSLLQQNKIQMFMEDLRYQQKLYEFLTYICTNSCDEVAHEMIFIVNAIWQHYIQIQHLQYSYQKLILQSKNLVELFGQMIKNHSSINYLTLQNTLKKSTLSIQERDQEYKKIIQFLIITIFLIISQYFANPFYQDKLQSELKRHVFFNNYTYQDQYQGFSDEQESQQNCSFLKGRKRIK